VWSVINSQRSSVDGWSHLPHPPLSPQPSVCCWQHLATRRCCQQLIDRRLSLVCITLANGGRAIAIFSKSIWDKVPQLSTLIFADIPISLKHSVAQVEGNLYWFYTQINIVPIGDWGHLLTLTLISDDLESHIVVNVSSTSNIVPGVIKIGRSRFFANFEVTWLDN